MTDPRHNHPRFRNGDGPWSPCPPDCPLGGLHEWRCPSCGAITRARMADHDAAHLTEARRVLADLTGAVARGDEVGLPEAYRAAVAFLRKEADR